ncbi:MAG: translation initiation factor IF-2 [Alphaproteobacteria bacterium]|jgi:translation initiation factor IF-2|nr:translation initiation factor IF-2 [Alphaproteobacteria bacterium]
MTAQNDTEQDKKKTLSLSGKKLSLKKPADAGQIRQSFSHGRSRAVEVEVKRKRVEGGGPQGPGGKNPGGLTDSEWESRMRALKQAQEQAGAYEAELERKKQEAETLHLQRRNREEEQLRLDQEREAQRLIQQEEARRLVEEKAAATVTKAPVSDAVMHKKAKPSGRHDDDVDDEEEAASAKKTSGTTRADVKRTVAPAASSSAKRHKTRQQLHQISYEDAVTAEEGVPGRSFGARRAPKRKQQPVAQEARVSSVREVIIPEAITVQELSNRMAVRGAEVIKFLMSMGVMATINQSLDAETAEIVVNEFGLTAKRVSMDDVVEGLGQVQEAEGDFQARPPVVTIMGHVDHGKTSLLDALRRTDVVSSEAGGITQHIGAYQVHDSKGRLVTFIDTPGHAAFTQMRSRGANVTDIVILVVAADDGIKEQTIEAIHHAKAAGVPIIVAINKMDKPEANPERVRQELLQHELVVEELGGDILAVEVSAKKSLNLDKLLDVVMLQAEIMELKANPNRVAKGIIIESKVEAGRGAVGTVLVQQGTLTVGDIFVAGSEWGRVRALVDYTGVRLTEALPSQPVEVLGFGGAPTPGEEFVVVENEARAREISDYRLHRRKEAKAALVRKNSMQTLMQGTQTAGAPMRELSLVIKSDVQGSVEAIMNSLHKLATDEVSVRFLHTGVGGINESDVSLASASQGLVVGFNVRANPQARELAARDQVEIRYYSIIYDVLDDMKAMMGGLLAPTLREKYLGAAEVRQVFTITKVGRVAGCYVTEGMVKRGARVRILRDNMVIYEGVLKTLKRFKDEVKEAKEGYECGITFEGSQDIREGDAIECFEVEEIARSL